METKEESLRPSIAMIVRDLRNEAAEDSVMLVEDRNVRKVFKKITYDHDSSKFVNKSETALF